MTLLSLTRQFSSNNVTASGSLQLGDTWGTLYLDNAPFTPDLAAAPQIKLALSSGSDLAIGGGGLSFKTTEQASIDSHLQLFWPDPNRAHDPFLDVADVLPGFDQPSANARKPVGLMLSLNGTAAFTGSLPNLKTGALSTALDLQTGGNLNYARLIVGEQSDGARDLIDRLLGGLRLPQDPGGKFEPGEAIALTYGGYLKFKSTTTWGYALTGAQKLSFDGIESNLAYGVKLGPSVSLDVEVAGQFQYRVRADLLNPGWTLLTVHTLSDHSGGIALDIGVTAEYAVTGGLVDRSFYETVSVLLGVDPQSLEKSIKTVSDLSTIDGLRNAAGDFLAGEVDDLVKEWLPQGLAATDFAPFVTRLGRAVAAYSNLDKTVHAFISDNLDQTADVLNTRVAALVDAAVAALTGGNTAAPALQDLAKWLGPKVREWSVNQAKTEFAKFKAAVLDATDAGVDDLMSALDTQKLKPVLDELAKIQKPEDLQAELSAKTKALIAKLLERPFDELASSPQLKAVLDKIQGVVAEIQDLQAKWSDIVAKAAKGKFTADFAASFKRATSEETLLEASFNFNHPAAGALYEKALAGDFTALLDQDAGAVQLRRGSIENKLTTESSLSIALFGGSASTSFKVTQDSVLSLESGDSGQIMVYTSTTAATQTDKSSWNGNQETKVSTLALVASAPVRDVDGVLEILGQQQSLGLTYDVVVDDSETTSDELLDYLVFAEQLALIPSAAALRGQIAGLVGPAGFPLKLTAKYAVSISAPAIQGMLQHILPQQLDYFGRVARRRYYDRYYTALGSRYRGIVKGYNLVIDSAGNLTVPSGALIFPNDFDRPTVDILIKTENDTMDAFQRFRSAAADVYAGKPTAPRDYDAAIAALMKARDAIDVFLPGQYSAMFAILDVLVASRVGIQPGYRSSRLELTLTAAGAAKPFNLVLAA